MREHPELARFQFRANTRWVDGTWNRTTIDDFHGAGAEQHREQAFAVDADHPAVLVGQDRAPTPAEHLLQALGSCLTSGLANIAAARGIQLGEVTARVEGDAGAEQLRRLVDQARSRSAVYDVLTNGVPVTIDVASA